MSTILLRCKQLGCRYLEVFVVIFFLKDGNVNNKMRYFNYGHVTLRAMWLLIEVCSRSCNF